MRLLTNRYRVNWYVKYLFFVASVIYAIFMISCGERKKEEVVIAPHVGRIEAIFNRASATYQIPKNLLLAVAFKESGFSTQASSALYLGKNKTEIIKGVELSQTAFGVSLKELGIEGVKENDTWEVQVDAYARWIKNHLSVKRIELTGNPRDLNETYEWIWNLAQIHRKGKKLKHAIRVIFIIELMQKLNQGDYWQDPDSGETVRLLKASPKLVPSSFDEHIATSLNIRGIDDGAQIPSAVSYHNQIQYPTPTEKQKPDRIVVVHCPFNLSACLDIQNQSYAASDGIAKINAHFLIPQDANIVDSPLQLVRYNVSLTFTDEYGEDKVLKNTIIIMLAGNSGRYIRGKRVVINPTWYSKYQLEKMGLVINQVCDLLKVLHGVGKQFYERCTNTDPTSEGGVKFLHQKIGENHYKWGDIPDFDPTIYHTYVANPDRLSGIVSASFGDNSGAFEAKRPVKLKVDLLKATKFIKLEQLTRCRNSRVVWAAVERRRLDNVNSQEYDITLYDPGPNGNGQHFFRIKAWDNDELIGWNIADIYINNYNPENDPDISIPECQ